MELKGLLSETFSVTIGAKIINSGIRNAALIKNGRGKVL